MKLAFRQLAKSPGFTLVVVLTLALGIGANTAIFSVINSVLLRPLPYDQPERLMNIWQASQKQNFPKAPMPPGIFFDLQAQSRSFAALAAWTPNPLNLSGDHIEAERLEGTAVTDGFSAVLRTSPARGRFFSAEEYAPGQDGVVILSHALWQQRFGSDIAMLGRTIQLNGRARTVVGVMPEGFNYPGKTVAWIPYAPAADIRVQRDWHLLRPIGRLKDGVRYEQAGAELQEINRAFAAQHPDTDADWSMTAFPMLADAVNHIRPALLLLSSAVVALLLIACANVANLLLARAATRRQEIAIRLSLGASRWRIVRQLLAETLLLFALGGAAGLLLAEWGLGALLALAPAGTPRVDQIAIDGTALLFTSGITLATGLVFGLIPAWRSSRSDLSDGLHHGGRGATESRGLLRPTLVVLQLAAAVTLLVVAGLLIRAFDQVRRVNLGFDPERVLTFRLDLPAAKYDSAEKNARFVNGVAREIAALPGVEAVGATTAVPLAAGPIFIMRFEGRPPVTPSNAPVASQRVATNDYFRAMGISLIRGRLFGPQDIPGAPHVCVINQALAQKYFPNQNPIGQRLEIGFDDPPAWREIVGIVADQKSNGADAATPVQVFEPPHQWQVNSFNIAVRAAGDPAALVPSLRATVQKLDRTQPVHTIKPMTQLITESLAQRTFTLVLLSVFAAVAVLLAAIGLYGVISYGVAQRTREFGVRLALGAPARDVLGLVLREGLLLTVLGLGLGLASAFGATQLVQAMLFGVEARDPLTFAATAALLATIALFACAIPALRATRVDPMVALRTE